MSTRPPRTTSAPHPAEAPGFDEPPTPCPTGIDPFDQVYGGFMPGEVVILSSDVLRDARVLALDIVVSTLRGAENRGQRPGEVLYYRAGAHGSGHLVEAGLRRRLGDQWTLASVEGVAAASSDRRIHADELAKRFGQWANRARSPVLVVVETVDDVAGRFGTIARAFKPVALQQLNPIIVIFLAFRPHATPPKNVGFDQLGAAADFIVHLVIAAPVPVGQRDLLRQHEGGSTLDVVKARPGPGPRRLYLPEYPPDRVPLAS